MVKPVFPTLENGRITSVYGYRTHPITKVRTLHDGIDIAPRIAGTRGVPVFATEDGQVKKAEHNKISGNRVFIYHPKSGYTTVYCHLEKYTVKNGQNVKRGQQIGVMGTTGNSTGIHLHFGVSKKYPVKWGNGGTFIDPDKYLIKATPSINAKYHTVKSGDTVSGLARKYGSTQEQIKDWNKLKNINLIRVGQKLRVR